MHPLLADLFLWAYVIMLGILLGGALFERGVLVSVWASSPPDSVRDWNSDPRYMLDPPRRFFIFATLPVMALTPVIGYIGFHSHYPLRCWLLTSATLVLLVIIATFAYFSPTIMALTMRRGMGMDSKTIVKKTRQWVSLQYIRLTVLLLGWICALQAFRVHG